MVPVTHQSPIVICLEVDLLIYSAYGIRKFLMQVKRDQVRTIGELEKKIQFDLGITNNIGLFYANEFYMFPDMELSKFEDLGMSSLISVRPSPVKLDAGHSTQHNVAHGTPTEEIKMDEEGGENNHNDSRNSEADGDSGMSDTGEEDDCISMNHTSSEQVGQIGNQNVETAAEKQKDSEDSVLSLEQADSLASTMPLDSTCESTSPCTTEEAGSIPLLDLSIQPNETIMMPPPRQSPRFGPLTPALRKKVSFSPNSFTSPKLKSIKKKYPKTPKFLQRQALPVISGGYSKVTPPLAISRHGALENLTNTSDGTQVMQDNLELADKERSSLEIGEEVNVGTGTSAGYKTVPENDTTIDDSAVLPKSI